MALKGLIKITTLSSGSDWLPSSIRFKNSLKEREGGREREGGKEREGERGERERERERGRERERETGCIPYYIEHKIS